MLKKNPEEMTLSELEEAGRRNQTGPEPITRSKECLDISSAEESVLRKEVAAVRSLPLPYYS